MFFNGEDFPFNRGGNNRNKPVDNSKYYDLLGVNKDSSDDVIKKAYKKNALKHHPDRGGDADKFKELSQAYEVLSDPKKKEIYDKYGEEGLTDNGMNFSSANDIFNMFFNNDSHDSHPFFGGGNPFGGMGGNFSNRRQNNRSQDTVTQINVSLKDLFTGTKKKFKIKRKKAVSTGNGIQEKKCDDCNGKGVKVQIIRQGPMIQQIQSPCNKCNGTGKIITGKKIITEEVLIELEIEKGMSSGDKIVFENMSDETLYSKPGNLIFVINEVNDSDFERQNDHLIMKKEVKLCDALCGFEFVLKHLDNSDLLVTSDSIINGENIYTLIEKGMPIRNSPGKFGNLYIKFIVIYPDYNSITNSVKSKLKEILDYDKSEIINKYNMENVLLIEQEYESNNSQNYEYPEDSEVNCRQQ